MGGWVKMGGSKFEVFRSNKRQKVISHMDRGLCQCGLSARY